MHDARRGSYCSLYAQINAPADLKLVLGALRSQQAAGLRADNGVATLDQAKAEFDASWKKWKAWAGLEEVANKPRNAADRATKSAPKNRGAKGTYQSDDALCNFIYEFVCPWLDHVLCVRANRHFAEPGNRGSVPRPWR